MSGVALPWMPNEGSSFVGRDRLPMTAGEGIDPVPIFWKLHLGAGCHDWQTPVAFPGRAS